MKNRKTKTIITINDMNDKEDLFVYFNILKIRHYTTLLFLWKLKNICLPA